MELGGLGYLTNIQSIPALRRDVNVNHMWLVSDVRAGVCVILHAWLISERNSYSAINRKRDRTATTVSSYLTHTNSSCCSCCCCAQVTCRQRSAVHNTCCVRCKISPYHSPPHWLHTTDRRSTPPDVAGAECLLSPARHGTASRFRNR